MCTVCIFVNMRLSKRGYIGAGAFLVVASIVMGFHNSQLPELRIRQASGAGSESVDEAALAGRGRPDEVEQLVARSSLPALESSVRRSIKLRDGMIHMSVQRGIVQFEMETKGRVCGSLSWPVEQPVSFSANQCAALKNIQGYDHCASVVPVSVLHNCSFATFGATYGPPCILHMQEVSGRRPSTSDKPCILRSDQYIYWEHLFKARVQTMIDVGAHDGENINVLAHYGVKVYAFEPSSDQYNVQFITQSLASLANSTAGSLVQRMLPFAGGVGPVGRGIAFEERQRMGKRLQVSVHALSDIVHEPVGLLKMDCEGCEPKALLSAVKLICVHGVEYIFTEFFPKAIQAVSSGWTGAKYLTLLQDLGFQCECWSDYGAKQNVACAPGCADPMRDPSGFVHEVMHCKKNIFDLTCKRVRPPSQKLCQASGL